MVTAVDEEPGIGETPHVPTGEESPLGEAVEPELPQAVRDAKRTANAKDEDRCFIASRRTATGVPGLRATEHAIGARHVSRKCAAREPHMSRT